MQAASVGVDGYILVSRLAMRPNRSRSLSLSLYLRTLSLVWLSYSYLVSFRPVCHWQVNLQHPQTKFQQFRASICRVPEGKLSGRAKWKRWRIIFRYPQWNKEILWTITPQHTPATLWVVCKDTMYTPVSQPPASKTREAEREERREKSPLSRDVVPRCTGDCGVLWLDRHAKLEAWKA